MTTNEAAENAAVKGDAVAIHCHHCGTQRAARRRLSSFLNSRSLSSLLFCHCDDLKWYFRTIDHLFRYINKKISTYIRG